MLTRECCFVPKFKIGKTKYKLFLFLSPPIFGEPIVYDVHSEIENRARKMNDYYIKLGAFRHSKMDLDFIHKKILYIFFRAWQ